jgi:hypothetical protein
MPPEITTADATTTALRRALDAAHAENARLRSTTGTLQTELQQRAAGERAAQLTALDTSIAQADSEANGLQERWVALQTEGNLAEAGKVMRQMGEATAKADRLKAQKQWLSTQAEPRQPARQVVGDLDLTQFNDAERNWIATNTIYATSPEVRARVNDAAMKAIHRDGLVKDSPEYFAALERAAYPERAIPAVDRQAPAATGGDIDAGDAGDGVGDGSPLSGAADLDDDGGDSRAAQISLDRHTRNADAQMRAVADTPAMRIEVTPQADASGGSGTAQQSQRVRAAGKEGGASMRSVAAPPSRRVMQASNRAAQQHGGVIEPTKEEIDTAITLAESIEPDLLKRGTEEVVRWYYTLYHSPTHRSAKRRNWVYGSAA